MRGCVRSGNPLDFYQVVGRVRNDTTLECVTPRLHFEGVVSLIVTFEYGDTGRKTDVVTRSSGTSASVNDLLFQFYVPESVSDVRPREGPSQGGTVMSVKGKNFRNTPELVVRFVSSEPSSNGTADGADIFTAAATVPARFIDIAEIIVEAPRCPLGLGRGGSFFVEVSSNGVDFTASTDATQYYYVSSKPVVMAISPHILREGGGAELTIIGSGFPVVYPRALLCVFADEVMVPVSVHSPELLTCTAPPIRPGSVTVSILSHGQKLASVGELAVEYIEEVHISSSSPLLGPATGGTTVTILGKGFHPEEEYMCAFGSSQPVYGKLVNNSAVTCNTPMKCGSESSSEVVLRLLIISEVGLLRNTHTYAGFPENKEVNVSAITSVEEDDVLGAAFLFFRYYEVEILRLIPANGPIVGGTDVRVSGSGFLRLSHAACQFGVGEPTPARIINAWTLVCQSTSFASAAGVMLSTASHVGMGKPRLERGMPLRVTMNGVDFSPRNTSEAFFYDDDVEVLGLVPDRGPATGGVRILVRGSGFRADERLACRFGLQTVEAEYLQSDTIECLAPAQARLSVVPVSVTLNGQDFYTGRQEYSLDAHANGGFLIGPLFTFTNRASVIALQPNQGPTRGGTIVRVLGLNFVRTSMVLCRFGTVVTSEALFVSTQELTCVSPAVPVETGSVYVEVYGAGTPNASSANKPAFEHLIDPGDDPTLWTFSKIEFTFMQDVEVLTVFPSSGPSAGGSRVSLAGSGFQDLPTLGCRFGSGPLSGRGDRDFELDGTENPATTSLRVAATYVSASEVVCITPEFATTKGFGDAMAFGETVHVAITLNGQDYGLKMAQFTYYLTPKVWWSLGVCMSTFLFA